MPRQIERRGEERDDQRRALQQQRDEQEPLALPRTPDVEHHDQQDDQPEVRLVGRRRR